MENGVRKLILEPFEAVLLLEGASLPEGYTERGKEKANERTKESIKEEEVKENRKKAGRAEIPGEATENHRSLDKLQYLDGPIWDITLKSDETKVEQIKDSTLFDINAP